MSLNQFTIEIISIVIYDRFYHARIFAHMEQKKVSRFKNLHFFSKKNPSKLISPTMSLNQFMIEKKMNKIFCDFSEEKVFFLIYAKIYDFQKPPFSKILS